MSDVATEPKSFVYKISGRTLELYEVDTDGEIDDPISALTDGIRIEYFTGKKVFVTTATGVVSDDTSPDEDSFINLTDSYMPAILDAVRARFAEWSGNVKDMEYWDHKFEVDFAKADEAYLGHTKMAIPRYPYAIR